MPDESVKLVIADDHAVVRSGLRMLLDAEEALHVVAEAGNVPDAMRMVRAHRPTVAVLDLNMPGGSILEAIPQLRESTPETAIVVLTMQDDPALARRAPPGRCGRPRWARCSRRRPRRSCSRRCGSPSRATRTSPRGSARASRPR